LPGVKRAVTPAALLALALSAAALGGCMEDRDEDVAAGEQVFRRAACGDCHTLAAAGSTGTKGPNLDQLRPEASKVVRQVTHGGPGMPSFSERLSSDEIGEVAAYVSSTAGDTTVAQGAKFELTKTELSDCDRGDLDCLDQAFGNLTYHEGAKPALNRLQRMMDANPLVQEQCHRIGHTMGGAGLARYEDAGRALAAGSTVCWSGYYHGVLEDGFYGTESSELGEKARELCSDASIRRDLFLLYQCVHGLGHGLMIFTGYDLPKALDTCDELATPWDRDACTGGTFMENFTSFYQVESKWLRDDDLLYPCNAVAERRKYHCYQLVTMRILDETGRDWQETARACKESEPAWVEVCYQSFGRDASGIAGRDQSRAIDLCRLTGRYQPECIFAVVRNIAYDDGGRLSRAVDFCQMAPVPTRARCYQGLGTAVAVVERTDSQRVARCSQLVSDEYVGACWTGVSSATPLADSSSAGSS
jgi:mono/diheme cytochrome c family protein